MAEDLPIEQEAAVEEETSVDRQTVRREPPLVCLVAGEHSGDALGAKLMDALADHFDNNVHFMGVGGEKMTALGFESVFEMEDVAVMGPLSILPRLPRIIRRVYQVVDAIVAAEPDVVVIIDSPEFTHPIAKRVRRRMPRVPIIDYVSPTVWAWRPGRAAKMRKYVDHVLALLPFEPEAHRRLNGPECTYVGHPLVERLDWLEKLDAQPLLQQLDIKPDQQILVVLPGSRPSEISHLMEPFGEAIRLLVRRGIKPKIVMPVQASVRHLIEAELEAWPLAPHLVDTEEEKFQAFLLARAALAASGTVTLELAVAGSPMVIGYRVDALAAQLRFLVKVPSFVLANLVLGRNAFPELIQEECEPHRLAGEVEAILADSPQREMQLDALVRVKDVLNSGGREPSKHAAEIIASYL